MFVAPNGIKVLKSLGFDLGRARASRLDNWVVASGISLTKLEIQNLTHAPTSFGNAYYAIHRMDLHTELMRIANIHNGCDGGDDAPNGPILHLSSPVAKVDAMDGKVELQDGTVHRADIVVGADGLRSVVRGAVQGNIDGSDMLQTKLNAFRFLIPTQELLSIPEGRNLMSWKHLGLALFVDSDNIQDERSIVWYPCRENVDPTLVP